MNNKQLAEAAKILGVSEDSIIAMDDEIKNSMTAVFEQVTVKNDEDKKAVYEALDTLWQKGSIYVELHEVAMAEYQQITRRSCLHSKIRSSGMRIRKNIIRTGM